MDGVRGEGLVDPGEELGMFENRGGAHISNIPKSSPGIFCAAVFIGMFKCSRA